MFYFSCFQWTELGSVVHACVYVHTRICCHVCTPITLHLSVLNKNHELTLMPSAPVHSHSTAISEPTSSSLNCSDWQLVVSFAAQSFAS